MTIRYRHDDDVARVRFDIEDEAGRFAPPIRHTVMRAVDRLAHS